MGTSKVTPDSSIASLGNEVRQDLSIFIRFTSQPSLEYGDPSGPEYGKVNAGFFAHLGQEHTLRLSSYSVVDALRSS
jgi:hypothetical protein